MRVNELIEWLESAKRISAQSGQDISDYEVIICHDGNNYCLEDLTTDHGSDSLYMKGYI